MQPLLICIEANQILCAARLLELAQYTSRIPILYASSSSPLNALTRRYRARLDPRFHPLDSPAGFEPLSTFFKLPSNMDILDLAQHKDLGQPDLRENISCWDFHVRVPESFVAWATPGFQLLKLPLPPRTELLPTYSNISTFMSDSLQYSSWSQRLPWPFPAQKNDLSVIPSFDSKLLAICHTFDFPSSLKNIEGMRSDEPSSYPTMLAQLHFSVEVEQIRE